MTCVSMSAGTEVIRPSKWRCTMVSASMSAPASHAKTDKRQAIRFKNVQRPTRVIGNGNLSNQIDSTSRAALTLIFLGFEFGESLFGAGNVGFSGAAQGEKFFLAMNVCFGGLELGPLAFGGGGV